METLKARPRRLREGYFARYCHGIGLDVGCGRQDSPGGEDRVVEWCRGWDKDDGDAHLLPGIAPGSLDWLHASHCLEHLEDPARALRRWLEVVRVGGHLLLLLPHRFLYEKSTCLPSAWNQDHKHFYLPYEEELPDTLGLFPLMRRTWAESAWRLVSMHWACDAYWANGRDHPVGEYSFESVVLRLR